MKATIVAIFLIFLQFSTFAAAKSDYTVKHFSKRSEFKAVKLSPTGKYLSAITSKEGKDVLAIFELNGFKLIHMVYFPTKAQVGNHTWVNEDRIVFQKQYLNGFIEQPLWRGELFAVNADGSKSQYLMGYNPRKNDTGKIKRKNTPLHGFSYVINVLEDDPEHVLAQTIPWPSYRHSEPHTVVYKVNIYSGKRKEIARSPARMGGYLTDRQGNVRFSASSKDYINQDLYKFNMSSKKWEKFDDKHGFNRISPKFFDNSGNAVFVTARKGDEMEGLYRIDLDTNKFSLISKNDRVTPSDVWLDAETREVYAVEYDDGYPSYDFVDDSLPSTKKLKGLLKALKDQQVTITSSTWDGKLKIIAAYSDKNPGDYYLFNAKTNKLNYLLSSRSWIDPVEMAEVKPIQFTARDGVLIDGYLTIPNNVKPKDLPLVVMPHGGPHGPRDWWVFNPMAQLYANNGIAVLQVNFRGSGGYGFEFEKSGHGKWGTEIQYDIIDGTKYLIEQGIADKAKICINGGSFGGYSSLQSSIIEPDLYKCSVAEFGIYDLELMFNSGDIPERSSGTEYLKEVLGEDKAIWHQYSPTKNVNKLKTALYIVHGGEDQRAPMEQADALKEALDQIDYDYKYWEIDEAGHGVYTDEIREEYYKSVLDFVKSHLID